MVVLFSAFWGSFILFFTMEVPIYIATKSMKVSLFSTRLPTLVSCLLDIIAILIDVIAIWFGFDVYFSDDLWFWGPFHVALGHFHMKMSIQLIYFLIELSVFSPIELCKFFLYFGYQLSTRYMILRYFLQFHGLTFHFFDDFFFFAIQKFLVRCSPTVYSCFYCIYL